jgi:hypothetical protein
MSVACDHARHEAFFGASGCDPTRCTLHAAWSDTLPGGRPPVDNVGVR